MFVVGLTGGIGSGKSTVADCFADIGIVVIDADQIAREVVEKGSDALVKIAEKFGQQILNQDGSLDRRALREIVFADKGARLWLEALLHPLIAQLLRQRIDASTSVYTILVSPLLLETNQHELVQRVLVVDVAEDTQVERATSRDQSDAETIRAIIASQINREARLAAADDVFDNEGPVASIEERVTALHSKYLDLAKN